MNALRWVRFMLRLMGALVLAGALLGAVPAAASAATCQAWTSPSAGGGLLTAVTVTSDCLAWVVGTEANSNGEGNDSLIEYWNGTAWSVQPSPDPSANINALRGVAAVSASDAWAVGEYHPDVDALLPFLVHWNGTAWSQVASPLSSGTSELAAVSASSASNVWAAGSTYNTTARAYQPLILHWNGTAWAEQASPVPSGSTGAFLQGVAAISASNAWAAGYYYTSTGRQALMLHWNGSTWAQVASPDPSSTYTELSGVAGTSGTNAWATGEYATSGTGYIFIEHWNGTAWSVQPSANPGAARETLSGVAASSAVSAWAVGYYGPSTGARQTLVEHWNGTAWTQVSSPDPGGTGGVSVLAAVAARGSNAGAIGYYAGTTGPPYPLAVHL